MDTPACGLVYEIKKGNSCHLVRLLKAFKLQCLETVQFFNHFTFIKIEAVHKQSGVFHALYKH